MELAPLQPKSIVRCERLCCRLSVRVCVARQIASQAARTKDTWRGQASKYPACVTETCKQGRTIREQLSPADVAACQRIAARAKDGAELPSKVKRSQEAARRRLARAGLVRDVPTIDGGPAAAPSDV